MVPRTTRFLGFTLAAALALLLVPEIGRAQVVVKVNDVVNFRMGFQLQGWSEWLQDPISEGYQQNFKIRRVRFLLGGVIAKNVSFFFQTDNPNLAQTTGTSTKATNQGFLVQDAFGEWKPLGNDMLILDFGKMLMPFTRNSLQQTSSHLSLDGGTWTFLQSTLEQGDAGRDVGLQLRHFLVDDHLEVRYGLFDGFRASANAGGAGSRNPFRFVGRVQWDFFDSEKGYVPVGTNLGKKKILAFGVGYDTQGGYTQSATSTTPEGKGYSAYGADFMIDWPFGPGDAQTGRDALTSHVDFIHYDGGCRPNAAGVVQSNCLFPTLPRQDEYFTDLGWFFHTISLQPFIRYEELRFRDATKVSGNIRRYMGGFNYYVTPAAQNLKLTAAWEKIVPRTAAAGAQTKNTNHFVLQLQFYYY
ncbi:MAG TPA: porin [Thermoanaerobaculia bacterium]|nr:porin [Thermoanaerobaculia bacterium]